RLRLSWTLLLSSPHLGQAWLSFLALTCTSMLPSACMHWLTISNSGRSRGTMIPWFTWLSLTLCLSMVRFSSIACRLFVWDCGFYSLERRTSFLLSFPSFCLTLPLLSPGRIESPFAFVISVRRSFLLWRIAGPQLPLLHLVFRRLTCTDGKKWKTLLLQRGIKKVIT